RARDLARVRAVRVHARRLHGRRGLQARALRGSRRRHLVPGRDRRDAGRAPGEAPAGAPERRGAAARRHPVDHHRRARDRGHSRRPDGATGAGELSRGPLLSLERHPGVPAAAARPPRGHSRAGRAFPRPLRRQARRAAAPRAREGRAPAPLRVAGERARAGERDRARGHPRPGRCRRADRYASARVGGSAARPLTSAAAADDARRDRARAHPPDPGALRTQPLERRRGAWDRPHHARAQAKGKRDRPVVPTRRFVAPERAWYVRGMREGHDRALTRRQVLGLMAAAAALPGGAGAESQMLSRPIPVSGETIPAVGLGTWRVFDVGNSPAERGPLKEVLKSLVELGGRVVDSSPMYGAAESVVGDLAAEVAITDKLFLATKVWTTGRDAGVAQMEQSLKRLRAQRLDLIQIHNLLDWRTHLRKPRSGEE